MLRNSCWLVLLIAQFINLPPFASGAIIYWADSDRDYIRRSNPDGSGVQNLVTAHGSGLNFSKSQPLLFSIAVDGINQKFYWRDNNPPFLIERANADGTGIAEDIVNELSNQSGGIALDSFNGKIYWADSGRIRRANLDGMNIEDILLPSDPFRIALDIPSDKVYFTSNGGRSIQRVNLDGTENHVVVSLPSGDIWDLALDLLNGKVYWTDRGVAGMGETAKIQRANLDGSDVEDVLTNVLAYAIALDPAFGKLYWSEIRGPFGGPIGGLIRRANLDGSESEDVVLQTWNILDIGIDGTGEIPGDLPLLSPHPDMDRDGDLDFDDIYPFVLGLNDESAYGTKYGDGVPPYIQGDTDADGDFDFDDIPGFVASLTSRLVVQGVPEPSTLALITLPTLAMVWRYRWRRRAATKAWLLARRL